MNFSDILQYLQGLTSGKMSQQNSQFGSNLGLQQQQVDNQNAQFRSNLGLQQQQVGNQNAQFGLTLNEQTAARKAAEALALEKQHQAELEQQFQQAYMRSNSPATRWVDDLALQQAKKRQSDVWFNDFMNSRHRSGQYF